MIRIVLADDHPIVLDALAQLFGMEPDFDVVVRCSDGPQALAAVRRSRPDVVLLDVRMPGLSGLEVLRAIHEEALPTRVVLLTAQVSDEEVIEAVRLGVGGIVLKESVPRMLVQVVRRVAAGEQSLDERTLHGALDKMLRREAAGERAVRLLTRRELEIVRMVAAGLRNKQIADKLSISEGTVKMHLHSIYGKVGVEGRMELSIYAREHELL